MASTGARRRLNVPRRNAGITLKLPTGKSLKLQVDLSGTISDLKAIIEKETRVPKNQQRIIFDDKQCEGDCDLAEFGIKEESTIKLALRLRGGGGAVSEFAVFLSRILDSSLGPDPCRSAWEWLKSLIIHEVGSDASDADLSDLQKPRKCWSNYSQKALWFAVAMFSAYLDHSTSTSLTVRDIFFAIAFVLFLAIDAALSTILRLPYWGNALVYVSGLLLQLMSCLLMVSFDAYYALWSILLVLFVIAAVAFLQQKFPLPAQRVDKEDLDHLFELSQGIANCGGLITAISGHYLAGPFNPVGLIFFSTIVLGLYLMMVITARVVAPHHAWYLAIVLMALLVITLITASITFVGTPGIKSLKCGLQSTGITE